MAIQTPPISRHRRPARPAVAVPFTRDATAPQLRPIGAPGSPATRDPGHLAPERLRPRSTRARLAVVVPRPRRRTIGLLVAALCAVLFVGFLGLAAVQMTLAQNQQRLDRLEREVQDARDYYDRLRLAVARLQSPDYIVPTATERLGMVPATSPLYLTPTADVVDHVAAATGEAVSDAASGTGAGRPEWGAVKEISGRAP